MKLSSFHKKIKSSEQFYKVLVKQSFQRNYFIPCFSSRMSVYSTSPGVFCKLSYKKLRNSQENFFVCVSHKDTGLQMQFY